VSRKHKPDLAGSDGPGGGVDPVDGLTAPQAKALAALLQEPTVARAADVAGVGERTLRRWLGEPLFRGAVFRARREAFGQAIWLTQRYAAVAVAALVKMVNDASVPPASKVSAATAILRFGREAMELDDLAERVEILEQAAKGEAKPRLPKRTNGNGNGSLEHDAEDGE
jgi:hypothetical protein